MLRALVYFTIFTLVYSTLAPLRSESIGRMNHDEGEVLLFASERTPTSIFFTPLPRLDPAKSECHENVLNGHVELSIAVKLYTSELIAAIHTFAKQRLSTMCSQNDTCDVSVLPVRAIRLVHKTRRTNDTRQLYTVNEEWSTYTAFPQSIDFSIHAASASACEQLRASIVERCRLSDFEVHYSLHPTKIIERSIAVNTDQVESTALFNRVRSRLPNADVVAMTREDFNELVDEVIKRLHWKLRVEQGFDSALKNPVELERALQQQLRYKQTRLADVDDPLWNSFYWSYGLTRPDRLAKAMRRIIWKDETHNDCFVYNSRAAKNARELGLAQHDVDRIEDLDEQLSRDVRNGSDKTNEPPKITGVESINGTFYSMTNVDVLEYLQELSGHLHLQGDIIRPKPIDVHLIRLSVLRTGTKLLDHPALLRIQHDPHVVPLRCLSPNSTTICITNRTLQLENQVRQLTSAVERLANQSLHASRNHDELERKVQQLTVTNERLLNQSSKYQYDRQRLNTTYVPNVRLVNQSAHTSQERKELQQRVTTLQPPRARNMSHHDERRQWKQQATTIAGGNRSGKKLNELYFPSGIAVDQNNSVFIADQYNNRIVRWDEQATAGSIMAGGKRGGNRLDQLNQPAHMVVDSRNHSLIVADRGNRRVVRWWMGKATGQQILISNIDCFGLAMDNDGSLYVSDSVEDVVTRWRQGERRGTVVAGGSETGAQLDQLNDPRSLFVDDDQSVYVADRMNHRVIKWPKDAREGVVVAGGNGYGDALDQLHSPSGVFVDAWGHIFVADGGNHRVMRYRPGASEGEVVVGDNGQGRGFNQLHDPVSVSLDDEGALYVADHWNHRIQKFELV